METNLELYDCAIIGGGLAGLSLSIQLAEAGLRVILFEKNKYPFQKVCGEYVSLESWDFLEKLGVELSELGLPIINKLEITSQKGFVLKHVLDLGGFGISRFLLDKTLSEIAISKGVIVKVSTKVHSAVFENNQWKIVANSCTYFAKMSCGSYGKYTPGFVPKMEGYDKKRGLLKNYIGVKYHIRTDLDQSTIQLHNFEDGYCGISKIEKEQFCFCYLTSSENLRKSGNNILELERNILSRNPFLKQYFLNSEFIWKEPLVISNLYFYAKQPSIQNFITLGDAAGAITPLCGNGMSMALHSSKILAGCILKWFDGSFTTDKMINEYSKIWNHTFKGRIKAGNYLQNIFGKENVTDLALKFLSKTPRFANQLVKFTHGKPF